jgi:hypothetical protein
MPRDRRYGGRTSIRDVDLYEGGYTPWERAGQAALSRTPEAFNYGSLEEKYPTRQVMPMVPSYVQNQIDEENIIRKSNEVALKTRQAQLDTYDSKLNEEAAIAEQVKLARKRFAALNPQDIDYQNKRDQIFIDLPYSEFSDDFRNGTVARLDRVNERYMSKIKPPTSGDPYKDYEDAYKAVTALRTAKPDKKTEYTKEDEIFESLQVQKMDQAMARMGGAMQPSTQQQTALAPTGEDADIITARKLISRKPELKEEINRRLISAGKPPIE